MPQLLIIEPYLNGHRGNYVRLIAGAAAERGIVVNIATLRESASHPAWASIEENGGALLSTVVIERTISDSMGNGFFELIKREFGYWRFLQKAYDQICQDNAVDCVIVPYLDYCANMTAALGSPFSDAKWCGIVMRQTFHHDSMGVETPRSSLQPLKKRFFLRLLGDKHVRKLFTIDETLVDYVRDEYPTLADRLMLLSDPASFGDRISRQAARAQLNVPAECHLVLVYGYMDRRKGIDTLMRGMVDARIPDNVHLMLAGVQGDKSEATPDNRNYRALTDAGRIHMLPKFLDDDEELAVFCAADSVWLGYRGHAGMSGILVQAGQMNLPVIACREGLIGWLTKKNKSGVIVDVDDTASVVTGINDLVRDPALAAEYGRNGHRRFANHTPAKFAATILEALV